MGYRVAADLVLVLHLLFIVFVIAGGLLGLRWRWTPWLHLPAVVWGVALEFFGWICPLTPLENSLRQASGAQGYEGGFIEHYILSIIYPRGLTPEIQIALGVIVLVINVAVYGVILRRRRRAAPEGVRG
ncbi:MAG: DUF2784 domain-containing protein [Longimicrobiales bacterium]